MATVEDRLTTLEQQNTQLQTSLANNAAWVADEDRRLTALEQASTAAIAVTLQAQLNDLTSRVAALGG